MQPAAGNLGVYWGQRTVMAHANDNITWCCLRITERNVIPVAETAAVVIAATYEGKLDIPVNLVVHTLYQHTRDGIGQCVIALRLLTGSLLGYVQSL